MPNALAELFNQGNALFQQGQFEAAAALYDDALTLSPGHPRVRLNRGQALRKLGRVDEAIADLEAAAAGEPGAVEPLFLLGDVWVGLRRPDLAVAVLEQALVLEPSNPALHGRLAVALRMDARPHDAVAAFRRALSLDPQGPARPFLGACELQIGDFENGWPDFEYRREPDAVTASIGAAAPRWAGQAIAGKTVLVYAEQGLGDTIQFCRYVPHLAAAGASVLFAPQGPLRRLLKPLAGPSVRLVDLVDPTLAFDLHVRTLSLPLLFGTRMDTVPGQTPYLSPEPALAAAWRARLGAHGFKIGVAWRGSGHAEDQGRNFDPRLLARIASLPGVRLISLQRDDPDVSASDLAAVGIERPSPDLDVNGDAFVDTAAVMQACDLVLTLDSALAHLAGSLGRQTWIAVPRSADWRWLAGRDDTPWYPTVRLWRQATLDRWDDVFDAMAAKLGNRP